MRYAFLFPILLVACSSSETARERQASGGKYYGGVFNMNEVEDLRSLFPHQLTQAASHRIAAQVYEGLVRFDQSNLSVVPALACRAARVALMLRPPNAGAARLAAR